MNKYTLFSILLTVLAGGLLLIAGWWLMDLIIKNLIAISSVAAISAGVLFWYGLHEKSPDKQFEKDYQ